MGVGMRRRNFMTALAGAAAYPILAGAQQKPMPAIGKVEPGSRVPVVGVLLNEPPEPAFAAFHEKFRELGYEEGRNVRLEIRSADAKSERLPGLAAELVRMKVDVIISAFISSHTRSDQRHPADPDRDGLRRPDLVRQQPRAPGRKRYRRRGFHL